MKLRRKIILNTICLTIVAGVMTACSGSGGGGNPPGDPGAGDTLSVANAPLNVEGSFVPNDSHTAATADSFGNLTLGWQEDVTPALHYESVAVQTDSTASQVVVYFYDWDGYTPVIWVCDERMAANASCSGTTIDKTAGTVTFSDQVLINNTQGSSAGPVTLNGTLKYTPPQ